MEYPWGGNSRRSEAATAAAAWHSRDNSRTTWKWTEDWGNDTGLHLLLTL